MFLCQNWHILETIFYLLWHIWTCQFGIKSNLAETALLFDRATDVPFLPIWTNEPKLVLGIHLKRTLHQVGVCE